MTGSNWTQKRKPKNPIKFKLTLNEDTCRWEAPVTYPTDGKRYSWDEATTNWKEVV